jgi:type I site-specific restriction endonuclease
MRERIRETLKRTGQVLHQAHHFAQSASSYSEEEQQYVLENTRHARDEVNQLYNDIQTEAEQKVLDRLAKNKAYRDREDRLSKNWLYVIFLLPGPAQYIDTITDDIVCEGLLRELGWSDARIEKLMKGLYSRV